jgi:sodium/potassium-transporting ATPase subunit alpha
VFRLGLFSNRLLLAGVGVEIALILLIVYTPPGNAAFGTAGLPARAWLFMAACALAIGLLEELRKALVRGARAR